LLDYVLEWEVLPDLILVNLVVIFLVHLVHEILEIVGSQLIGLVAGCAAF
jgi:hypothetical protein